jgi:exopolysaccharide biosynthesis polyprenyl glycosylphosphotransferase
MPKVASGAIDLVAIALAAWIAYGLSDVSATEEAPSAAGYAAFTLVMAPVWLAILARYGLYTSRRITSRAQEYRQVFHAIVVCVTATSLVDYALDVHLERRWVILTWVLALGLVASDREISRRLFKRLRMRGRMMRPILVVGANAEGQAIADMLDECPWLGYKVLGFTDDLVEDDVKRTVFGPTSKTLDFALDNGATGVVVATSAIDATTCNDLARELVEGGVYVELSSRLHDVASQRLLLRPLGRYPVVCLQPVRRTGWRGVAKRATDITIASLLLITSIPLMAIAALLIKLDSPGPVFFRQQRIGKDGKVFTILKFRTMCADAENRLAEVASLNEAHGPLFKIRNDPRTTRVGKVLRRLSIDEIPQLWNVLRDEMSMVGPRPALPSEADKWVARTRDRLLVKPGLTGMWQVNGRSNASFAQYEQLDLYYVDNWSLMVDLMIIMRTVPTLLARNGAY